MGKLVKLLPLILPLTVLSGTLCDWRSKTPPDLLEGRKGNSASDNYWFTHVSDVDQVDRKRHCIFAVHNDHPTNFLSMEWLRGDGESQLGFNRLAPGKCGQGEFDSTNLFNEDPGAYISYGPVLQFKKPDAALYVKVQPEKGEPPGVAPALQSRLVADLQGEAGEIERVDLEFGTGYEGKQFTYTVTNRGSQRAQFHIPKLFEAWSKAGSKPENKALSKWGADGDTFFADVGKPARYIIQVERAVGYEEAQVPIQVLSGSGEIVAVSQLTLYLPFSER